MVDFQSDQYTATSAFVGEVADEVRRGEGGEKE
jgi:hypothetical protein